MQRMIHNEEAETGSAEFKAKLALEAIKAHQMVAELTSRHELHPTQIAAWKREAVEKLAQVFDDKGGRAREDPGYAKHIVVYRPAPKFGPTEPMVARASPC